MVDSPPIPRFDAHTHLFHDRAFLERILKEKRLKVLVINVTGEGLFDRPMDQRWEAMTDMKARYPERFHLCTTFDPSSVTAPGFADRVIDRLARDIQAGATAVKVWKDIGLEVRAEDGGFVQIDDPRFQPIWAFLADRDVPVIAHTGEPRAAWQPLDKESPHYRFYNENPAYHTHGRDDVPDWTTVMDARDRWLEQNPDLTVVGAHLGSMAHDVEMVSDRLERYDNFFVDTAERFGDLVTQPSQKVRSFFKTHADRIVYGTDVILEHPADQVSETQRAQEKREYESMLADHWAYLTSGQSITVQDKLVEPVRVPGLDLPPSVLQAVYHDNAAFLYGGTT
ncbi:amidohydrolase family protein [Salinibacter altiplanensis]|uniref:amidohydrolase family protein n=1 Tax=Salinibacter altiplanensis TaxID=1803181 RepID=UPI0012FFD605|nr:amidohydrolase family protein [Salinibacter altiplanensis]